jgi:stalled ribosome alternative rescue factor ArfA
MPVTTVSKNPFEGARSNQVPHGGTSSAEKYTQSKGSVPEADQAAAAQKTAADRAEAQRKAAADAEAAKQKQLADEAYCRKQGEVAKQKQLDDEQFMRNKEQAEKDKGSYERYMSGVDTSGAAMLGANAYIAAKNAAENLALSIIGQKAAMAAAMLKLMNDLNDATVSFVKNIGSSVKSAAQ